MTRLNRVAGLLCCLFCLAVTTGCPNRAPVAGETRVFQGIAFQYCPPGTFAMGSPSSETWHSSFEALHEVTLTKGFWLSKYEVTQAVWEDTMGTNPSFYDGDNRPVESVSWNDVEDFLIVFNAAATDATYRLPTEAEWEYACRAGTTTQYYWGADPDDTQIVNYAWEWDNSSSTSPVGQKLPNAWGLYDMSGNVFEWCRDYSGDYPVGPVTDPQGPDTGTLRIMRGGCWSGAPRHCRSAARFTSMPSGYGESMGFRLVREAD